MRWMGVTNHGFVKTGSKFSNIDRLIYDSHDHPVMYGG